MKIVILTPWFAENMGYADNCLPKAIAALGHEVHVVTSNVKPYFNSHNYADNYEKFLGKGIVDCEVKQIDGYTLHRLQYSWEKGQLNIQGLFKKLQELKPDIVQSFDCFDRITYQAAFAKIILGYKLFLGCHVHASVFPAAIENNNFLKLSLKSKIKSVLNLRFLLRKNFLNYSSEKCYAISPDCADIAIRFGGIENKKVSVSPLGVDTEIFGFPIEQEYQKIRQKTRQELGFSESDIVCIYTGRCSEDKKPLYLAQAVEILAKQGKNFRALFIGDGPQIELEAIQSCLGSIIHSFVPVKELAKFYWAADIGVWPKQESTSQVDAMACKLPLILSNKVQVYERIDGNGLTYEEGNILDLANKIEMLSDPNLRQKMSDIGFNRVKNQFSWEQIAKQRIQDYMTA
ncbi:MAG: glycosyltransferase family 4 protein [Nostocales cyanobacterium ELA608]